MPWKHRFWLLEKQHSGTKNVSYLNSFCFVLLIVFLFIKAIFCFFYLVFLVKSHIYLCQWHSVSLSYYLANKAKFKMISSLTSTDILNLVCDWFRLTHVLTIRMQLSMEFRIWIQRLTKVRWYERTTVFLLRNCFTISAFCNT